MSTVVYRLKEQAALCDDTPLARLLFEAALEIERLQAREAVLAVECESRSATTKPPIPDEQALPPISSLRGIFKLRERVTEARKV